MLSAIPGAVLWAAVAGVTLGNVATLTGRVLDEQNRPVEGASVATRWDEGEPVDGAITDGEGRFTVQVQSPSRPGAILVMDSERERGALGRYKPATFEEGLELKLARLVKVQGRLTCKELKMNPPWSRVDVNALPGKISIAGQTSKEAEFSFLLPPGRYEFQIQGTDVKERTVIRRILGDEEALDLKTLNLEASRIAKMYGKSPPRWTLSAARGVERRVQLSDFKGRYVLLEFWRFSSIASTRSSLPALIKFHDEFEDRQKNFVILAFHDTGVETLEDLDQKVQNAKTNYWGERDLPFPILLDSSGDTFKKFGISTLPVLVVIDPAGRVVKGGTKDTVRDFLMKTDREVKKRLRKLKGSRAPQRFAKALEEAAAVGGSKVGYALYRYAEKYAKPDQMGSIARTLDQIGGLYAVAFFFGEHGMKSGDKQARLAAAKAIGKHGKRMNLSALMELVEAEKDPDVKGALEEAIRGIEDRP